MPFLTMKAPFSRYHEVAKPSDDSIDALRGIRPIAPVGIGNFRKHLPRVAGQLELHGDITKDLIEFGYESDDQWLSLLQDVESDLSPSHLAEHFEKGDIRLLRRGVGKEIIKILLRRVGIRPYKIKKKLGLLKT